MERNPGQYCEGEFVQTFFTSGCIRQRSDTTLPEPRVFRCVCRSSTETRSLDLLMFRSFCTCYDCRRETGGVCTYFCVDGSERWVGVCVCDL